MRRQLAQFTIKTKLKQSEEFEDDHDNNNYSNYVEDASVHTSDFYQSESLVCETILPLLLLHSNKEPNSDAGPKFI